MVRAVIPVITVKVNMESKSQKEATTSIGGRDGKKEVGVTTYMMIYVRQRASAKPTSKVPHWVWIAVDRIEPWWWELIILPSRKMIRLATGFIEKPY
ncbi:hypothetical protein SNOG_11278 [Parastagonospora nodorum SN15]|uniref:Uncharacterized protein n=1 Tax=Phaeosphaeria nodorum (strain SN15 / ATCC MYA-4574 / FGSC 10173) TaxID=321614 RepID=Q0UAD6_PHANO|nr:hypothetical protein SNOG_11278 [Parastagonospora nodorum SN15]EAT80986.1 hypothetical protein SNOG_11278 [Parastagonospora nodorum SN15]